MRYAPAPFRLLRTTLVGATILGLAAAAHVIAGGVLPSPLIMAALMALHMLCSTVATKFRLGLPAMLALLATSQLVLHQAFATLSVTLPSVSMPAGMHDHSQSAQAQAAAVLQSVAMAPATAPALSGMDLMHHGGGAMGSPMSVWMLAAHMAATLATALLLAHGENALWTLASWLKPLYRSPAAVLIQPAQQARPAVQPLPLSRLPWRNIRPDTRRGPPLLTAVFA